MRCRWIPLFALAACSGGGTVNLDDYDTSCMIDADCTAVFVGNTCDSSCRCPNAAINSSDIYRYTTDLQGAESTCGSLSMCNLVCMGGTPKCTAGACAQ